MTKTQGFHLPPRRKSETDRECCICHQTTEIVQVFGKNYCKSCYMDKPKSGIPGHSGMLRGDKQLLTLPFREGLNLQKARKGEATFATLFLEHYPKSKGILGRQLNYYIKHGGEIIGIIGFNSPPIGYKKFEKYFGAGNELYYLNNNVFRIIRTGIYPASQILSLALSCIKKDYPTRYGDTLIGVVTFVEPPRVGTTYLASGFDFLGYTQGKRCFRRGDLGKWMNKEWGEGTKKLIFAKWLLRRRYQKRYAPLPTERAECNPQTPLL